MSEASDRDENIAKGCLNTSVFLVAILIIVGMALGNRSAGDGADRSAIRWDRYDVTIDVREDGTIHVTEDQQVTFRGTFRAGYAEIPMERIDAISNVSVAVQKGPEDVNGDRLISDDEARRQRKMVTASEILPGSRVGPGEFATREEGANFRIDYGFDPTGRFRLPTSGRESRDIVLEYDAAGVIRDYPDAAEPWQQVHWMAISGEVTDIADIGSSTVTLILPREVPAAELAWSPEPDSVSGNRIVWHRDGLTRGDEFDVQVAFPAMTAATAPGWQPAADARDATIESAQNRHALASLLLLGAGVLVIVGGGIGLLYAWYARVHETVPGPVPDILPEPPDDLPAALVGSLVDEQVNPRDIAAAIMDLNHRGFVQIVSAAPGSGSRSRYAIQLAQPIELALPYEQVILNHVFRRERRTGATASFDNLRPLFGAYRNEVQDALNRELVERKYFHELPATSRRKWRTALKGFLWLSVLLAVVIVASLRSWTWWAILPPVAGSLVYLLGQRLTPSIARKTREGAEVSARWRAFERYLQQSGTGMFQQEWKTISEAYLPWVVAFGIDHQWLGRMNAPFPSNGGTFAGPDASPAWMTGSRPGRAYDSPVRTSAGSPGWAPSWGGWDASKWSDMQGASDSFLSSLGGVSDSLFSMMGDAMEAIGKSSGSGGGSGGSSFGGGSASSGGGSSHSSSGGGSRGFS